MSALKKLPAKLAVGLVLAILFDTTLQLVWKSAAVTLPSGGTPWTFVQGVLQNRLFLVVLLLMGLQFFNWLMVLAAADLSYAQPVTSLSYALVLVLSVIFLGETTDPWQVVGVALVLIGVWFISQTNHTTLRRQGGEL